MKALTVLLLLSLALATTSCSKKNTSDHREAERAAESREREGRETEKRSREGAESEEEENQPDSEAIGEDCVAFLRATTAPKPSEKAIDCPSCPPPGALPEVLKFNDLKIDHIAPSRDRCEVSVKILASFNPSTRSPIIGGLTAWISPEQKKLYLSGQVPSEQQTYKVHIIYRRTGQGGWHAVEFN